AEAPAHHHCFRGHETGRRMRRASPTRGGQPAFYSQLEARALAAGASERDATVGRAAFNAATRASALFPASSSSSRGTGSPEPDRAAATSLADCSPPSISPCPMVSSSYGTVLPS